MNDSTANARDTLEMIARAATRTRRLEAFEGYFFLVWGAFWSGGFLATQFLRGGLLAGVWAALFVAAFVLATVLGIKHRCQGTIRYSPPISLLGLAIAIGFGLWLLLARPQSGQAIALCGVCLICMAYVVIALVQRRPGLAAAAVLTALLALLAYTVFFPFFWVSLALLVGGLLAGNGLVRLRWLRESEHGAE
jgi:hypothetical protein